MLELEMRILMNRRMMRSLSRLKRTSRLLGVAGLT